MNDLKWRSTRDGGAIAKVGNLYLQCYVTYTKSGKRRFFPVVYMVDVPQSIKSSPIRHSLEKAQQDALRIAQDVLLDFHEAILQQMRLSGLEVPERL